MIPISDKQKTKKEEVSEEVQEEINEAPAAEETEAVAEEEEEEEEKTAKEEKKAKKKEKEKKPSKEKEAAVESDRYLRLYAEFDNYKKRTEKEKQSTAQFTKAQVVKDFLPVYDNLERALGQKTEDEAYYKGVEMIMAQFTSTLEKLGVTEIPALGEKFDPEIHNAVMHVDDPEKGENEVVEVFQKGFRTEDKVIRFAVVKVAN